VIARLGMPPHEAAVRVFIVEEATALAPPAANALLKTLEEPPAHVKFVLCTTEPDKLPITILSRCQRFDFQTVDPPAISRRLAQIVEAEGAEVTPEALALIARRAAGSMRDSQSLLEQLLGSAAGPIGVDEVHAVIGTGREEKVGELITCLTARDARGALAAFDAATAGGADAGGVLEQVLAALRDSLMASVGCGAELMLQGDGLGVDLAAVGRQTGTVTLLAMLQIVDHALGRMRSSGHAAVLAEMAIVRLASLEDLDSLADAVERVGTEPAATTAPATRLAPANRPAPAARPAAAVRSAEPEREKKTTDLTQPAPVVARPEAVAVDHQPKPAAVEPASVGIAEPPRAAGSLPEEVLPAAAAQADIPPSLPSDPLDSWRRGAEAVGGLAVDFAELASRATWRDDVLEVVLPGSAGNAAAFLRRPEIAAGLTRALAELVGRPVRHCLVIESTHEPATANSESGRQASAAAERGRPATSQIAMLREAAEHPMVAHVRTLFDAAVRKVEPPRPRTAAAVPPMAAPTAEAAAGPAVADDDERDDATADDSEGGQDYGGVDG